jgi:hypothetical protein
MDGLDLAAAVAKHDPEPEVKAIVVHAFAFRGADRHFVEVLRDADEKTFDLLARTDVIDELTDNNARKGLDAARAPAKVWRFDLRPVARDHQC